MPRWCLLVRALLAGRVSLDRLHLDSDAVDRRLRGVEDPAGLLRCHVYNQTSIAVPRIDRLYNVPVWRQLRTVWSKIMHRWLDLVEHEDGRPPMMVDVLRRLAPKLPQAREAARSRRGLCGVLALRLRRPTPDPK